MSGIATGCPGIMDGSWMDVPTSKLFPLILKTYISWYHLIGAWPSSPTTATKDALA